MEAGNVVPQGYASPHIINLDLLTDLLLVAAGTERSLSGVDVRIRGAPHRCIGNGREVLVGPRITSAKSTSGKHGKPFKNSPKLLPTIVGAQA